MQRRQFLHAGVALSVGGVLHGNARTATEYRPLGTLRIPNTKDAVVGDDGWVYIAIDNGYAVVDASDPTAPELVFEKENIKPPGSDKSLVKIWDVDYDADRLLVASQDYLPSQQKDAPTGFLLLDVSDPANPERVLFQETSVGIHNGVLVGDYVFHPGGTDDSTTVSIWDVSGSSATKVGVVSVVEFDPAWKEAYPDNGPGAHSLWVHDDYLYTASWDAGVFAVDISDPTAPEVISNFAGFDAETIANWSDKKAFSQYYRPPGNTHSVTTNQAGNLLGICGEAWKHDGKGGPMGIDLYDVSDPVHPERLAYIEPPESPNPTEEGYVTTAHNLEFHDGILYSSWVDGGVKRHDITDPTNPQEETWWRHPNEARFWTARVLEPGESFIASSKGVNSSGVNAALYVFPDEPGESLRPFQTESTPSPTQTPTATSTQALTDTQSARQTKTTETTTPGFGAFETLGVLGLGALWRRRRKADNE